MDFPISRNDAVRLVLAHVATLSDRRDDDPDMYPVVHLSKEPLRAGELHLRVDNGPLELEPAEDGSWVAMVDLYPSANWSHDCVYLFLDANRQIRELREHWFPADWEEADLKKKWTLITTHPFQTYHGKGTTYPGGRAVMRIRREEALALVRERVQTFDPTRKAQSELFMSKEVVPAESFELKVGQPPPQVMPHAFGSWVAMLDFLPAANWAHPCYILVVDPDGTMRESQAHWPPHDWETAYRAESVGDAR